MNRILSYYHPNMPRLLVSMLVSSRYDPDHFLAEYIKFQNLSHINFVKNPTKASRFYTIASYYIWVVYLLASIEVFQFSQLGGIVAFLISPLIVVGGIYACSYSYWQLKNTAKKLKNPRKK